MVDPAIQVRLEIDNRHATAMGDALSSLSQQLAQTDSQIRPSEELNRLCIFGKPPAKVHLMKVRGKLGKGKLALRDVVVGLNHLAPRTKPCRGFRKERIWLRRHLLRLDFEPLAHEFALGCTGFGCLWRVYQREKSLDRV